MWVYASMVLAVGVSSGVERAKLWLAPLPTSPGIPSAPQRGRWLSWSGKDSSGMPGVGISSNSNSWDSEMLEHRASEGGEESLKDAPASSNERAEPPWGPPGGDPDTWRLLLSEAIMLWTVGNGLEPTRLLRPWDFPGKNSGLGCRFLTQDRTHLSCVSCTDRQILYCRATWKAPITAAANIYFQMNLRLISIKTL